MGGQQSQLTPEELNEYEACSFFRASEIVTAHKEFSRLNPNKLERVDMATLCQMRQLKNNPFQERICQVFSTDGSGSLNFDEFLDMFSTLSARCPADIKAQTLFLVYDFDRDGFISKSDVKQIIAHIAAEDPDDLSKSEQAEASLREDEIESLAAKVMKEVDMDGSGTISFYEFSRVLEKVPDFASRFTLSLS